MRKLSKLIAVVILVLGLPTALFAADPTGAPEKVHPWVWAHTENGASAEFLVVLKAQADISPAYELGSKDLRGNYVYNALYNAAEWHQTAIRAWLKSKKAEFRSFYIVNALWVKGDRQLVLELAAWDDVERIEGNPVIQNELPKPDPLDSMVPEIPQAIEWNITKTQAPGVWALGFTGQGIVVGGQDTGYRWTHNAIKGKYRGWDGTVGTHDYNWHDSIHSGGGICGADATQPCDDYGHGTHTMGTVLGDDGGANQIGMAPGAKWIGCRNMDQGAGTPARYLECFEFFLAPYPVGGTPAQGDPTKAPDVTSNSWTCPPAEGCTPLSLEAAIDAQKAAGIMTVAAAGNAGSACNTVYDPPAIYASSYSIGSTTASDLLSSFSSRGTAATTNLMKPDLVAPGSGVRSATNGSDSSYASFSGTSMATPNVAGGVALLWSARACYKNDQDLTAALLGANATRLTAIVEGCGGDYVNGPNNSWGYGLMNVLTAVNNAVAGPVAPTGVGSSVPGANQIEVTWNPVGGAISYEVYRSDGACPGGTFVLIATVASPPYLDATVSGGQTYSYKVKTIDSICASPYSTCTSQTATGGCTAAPTFAGVASVTNPGTSSCALDLAWLAATPQCGTSVTYNVYRDTIAGFVPAAGNQISLGVTGLAYTDSGLDYGTTYYYKVRAADVTNGAEDTNLTERSGTPTGAPTVVFSDPLEPASGVWSHSAATGTNTCAGQIYAADDWAVVADPNAHSPTRSWVASDTATVKDAYLVLPGYALSPGSRLSFWHTYSFENTFDGGVLEISTDGGAIWNDLGPAIQSGVYDGPIDTNPAYCSPIAGRNAWTGGTLGPMTEVVATLDGYAGQTASIRWRLASDNGVAGIGWHIDDISLTNTMPCFNCAAETQPPTVTPPAATSVDQSTCVGGAPGATGATSAALAAFLAGGSATDNCDPAPTRLAPQVGGVDANNSTFFPIGATPVTFRYQDAAGNIGTAASTLTVMLFYGDLNQDGAINAGDTVILSNYSVGNLTQGPAPFTAPLAAADVNIDTAVNAVDQVIIANYLVGNIPCMP